MNKFNRVLSDWIFPMLLLSTFFVGAIFILGMLVRAAFGAECPPGVPSCKVITIAPNEEAILLQPNGVFDTADRARFIDMVPITNYWREKLRAAPAGEVKSPPVPAETGEKQP